MQKFISLAGTIQLMFLRHVTRHQRHDDSTTSSSVPAAAPYRSGVIITTWTLNRLCGACEHSQ